MQADQSSGDRQFDSRECKNTDMRRGSSLTSVDEERNRRNDDDVVARENGEQKKQITITNGSWRCSSWCWYYGTKTGNFVGAAGNSPSSLRWRDGDCFLPEGVQWTSRRRQTAVRCSRKKATGIADGSAPDSCISQDTKTGSKSESEPPLLLSHTLSLLRFVSSDPCQTDWGKLKIEAWSKENMCLRNTDNFLAGITRFGYFRIS